jgi:ubiquinone/menaquinone biosynthesis C-methylase UbiE
VNDQFAKVAPCYRGRAPYAAKLFEILVRRLRLDPSARILDLCCGHGELAKGFSPHVREVVAVDLSSEMLAFAKADAPANVTYLQADVGSCDEQDFGRFDLVTIGRALEYLPRERTLALLARSIPPGGGIFVGRAEIQIETPWRREYGHLRRKYGFRPRTHGRKEAEYFNDSIFEFVTYVLVRSQVPYDMDMLILDALSYPSSNGTVAQNLAAFRNELEAIVRPHQNADGSFEAIVGSGGLIFRKR